MDWTMGYSASWDVQRVNPDTWADCGRIGGIGAVTASRSSDDAMRLIETATMEVEQGVETGWYRVYLLADQGGVEKVPICTMLFEQIKSRTDHGKVAVARGRSVLQPAADEKLDRGGLTPAGIDAARWARDMLAACTPAPIRTEGSFSLAEDTVHAPGTSVLKAVWDVLSAGGFCIMISGMGEITVGPLPTSPALVLDRAHAGLLVPGVDEDLDKTRSPNRYKAVFDDGEVFVAENRDESSALSYQARGRWVDADTDMSPTPRAGESRQAYVERRLGELSTVKRRRSYRREYWPGCVPYDLVSGSLPDNGIEGDSRVVSQVVRRDHGAVVDEVIEEEVRL